MTIVYTQRLKANCYFKKKYFNGSPELVQLRELYSVVPFQYSYLSSLKYSFTAHLSVWVFLLQNSYFYSCPDRCSHKCLLMLLFVLLLHSVFQYVDSKRANAKIDEMHETRSDRSSKAGVLMVWDEFFLPWEM